MHNHSQKAESFLRNLSIEEAVGCLHKIDYHKPYEGLLALAEQLCDDPKHLNLMGLANAVYGWMPTILKSVDTEAFGTSSPLRAIKQLRSVADGKTFLLDMGSNAPINRSWVGTSKFLHALKPDLFPIWDSRVAKHFRLKHPYQINSRTNYIGFYDFIHALSQNTPASIAAVRDDIEKTYGYTPSVLRSLELMLFINEPEEGSC